MKTAFATVLGALTFLAPAWAQTEAPPANLTFDVASVKLNQTTLNGNRSLNYATGGGLATSNATLASLVGFAWDVREYQIVNLPGWANSEGYDISAKVDPAIARTEPDERTPEGLARLRTRVKTLLVERFGLATHVEMRETPVYNLVAAKGGVKLTPSTAESKRRLSMNQKSMTCTKVTMADFASVMLQSKMGRTVIDKTGIAGEFDFTLSFAPDAVATPDGAASAPPDGPSLITALQEQLGLRLESGKGQTPFLVIDAVQRPSGN